MRIKDILNKLNNGYAIIAVDKKAVEIFRSLVASGEKMPWKKLKTFPGRRYIFFISEENGYEEISVLTYRNYLKWYQKDTTSRRAAAETEAEENMKAVLTYDLRNHYGADIAYNEIIRDYENSLRKETIFIN